MRIIFSTVQSYAHSYVQSLKYPPKSFILTKVVTIYCKNTPNFAHITTSSHSPTDTTYLYILPQKFVFLFFCFFVFLFSPSRAIFNIYIYILYLIYLKIIALKRTPP